MPNPNPNWKADLRALLKEREEAYAAEQAEQIATYAHSLEELLQTMQQNALESQMVQEQIQDQARRDMLDMRKRSAMDRLFVSLRMTLGRVMRGKVWACFQQLRMNTFEDQRHEELSTVEGQMDALRRTIVDMEMELNTSADALRRAEEGLRRVGRMPAA